MMLCISCMNIRFIECLNVVCSVMMWLLFDFLKLENICVLLFV